MDDAFCTWVNFVACAPIDRQYRDPLTMIWTGTAQAMGLRIERSAEVFASYDGEGTLTLGARFDPGCGRLQRPDDLARALPRPGQR